MLPLTGIVRFVYMLIGASELITNIIVLANPIPSFYSFTKRQAMIAQRNSCQSLFGIMTPQLPLCQMPLRLSYLYTVLLLLTCWQCAKPFPPLRLASNRVSAENGMPAVPLRRQVIYIAHTFKPLPDGLKVFFFRKQLLPSQRPPRCVPVPGNTNRRPAA